MKRAMALWSDDRHVGPLAFALASLVSLLLTPLSAAGEAGDTDPVGAPASMVFRDDELYMGQLFHGGATPTISRWQAIPTNDALTAWNIPVNNGDLPYHGSADDFNFSWSTRNVAAASGRLADASRDHAVVAWYRQDGQVRVVEVDLRLPAIDDSMRTLVPGSTTVGAGLDLAVGDLDLVADPDGAYHDEVVVARAPVSGANGCEVRADLLDGNLHDLGSLSFPTGTTCSTHVAAAIGDFDGDLEYEAAIAWTVATGSTYTLKVAIFGLVTDPTSGATSLAQLATAEQTGLANATIDLAAGAFVLDGKEQLVAVMGPASESVAGSTITGYLFELSSTSVLQAKRSFSFAAKTKTREVRATAGLFKYDPSVGYDVNRRQVGVAYLATVSNAPALETLGIEFDSSYTAKAMTGVVTGETLFSGYQTINKLDVTAGNFVGHGVNGTATSPVQELATTYFLYEAPFDGTHVQFYQHFRIPQGIVYTAYKQVQPPDQMLDTFLVAYDMDGDSWKLGVPTHMVMDQYYTLQSVVQEPPKHVDYLPVDPNDLDGAWEVQWAGAYSEFRVLTTDSSSTEIATSTKSTSSWDIGASADLDISVCYRIAGKNCEKSPISFEAAAKFGYEYQYQESTVDSQYAEASIRYDNSATLDDNVTGTASTLDLWRYPILGYDTGDPEQPYGYYEAVVPSAAQTAFRGGGMNHSDIYQPTHENHNLLSYPIFRSNGVNLWNPKDLGSISYTDPMTNQTISVSSIWNWESNSKMPVDTWDGTTTSTLALDFKAGSGTDTEKEHDNTLTEGLDLAFGIGLRYLGIHSDIDISASLDSHQSWGGGTTSENKDSKAKGLEIEKPIGEFPERAYDYTTAVYASTDGAFKVAHAVDPFGSSQGSDYWGVYGYYPDPALNLPYRFEWHPKSPPVHAEEWWSLRDVEDPLRKRMRGMFLRESEVDPASGEHNLLGDPPIDGDEVLLCARVYNYSFLDIPKPGFPVNFYYYLWDNLKKVQVGEPMTQPAMSTRVESLDSVIKTGGTSTQAKCVGWDERDTATGPTSCREVCVPWDTTGLNQAEGQYLYRFLVRVDEPTATHAQGEIAELHEGWDASGAELPQGNNEGYYPWNNGWSVMSRTSAARSAHGLRVAPASTRATLSATSDEDDVYLASDGIGIEIGDELVTQRPELVAGQRYAVRIHVVSGSDHAKNYLVTFFDGDPSAGGTSFATAVVHGLTAGDNYTWGEFTPKATSVGEHDVYAHIEGKVSAPDRDDHWATIHANVRSADESGGDGGGCECSRVGGTPRGDGSPASFLLATLLLGTLRAVSGRRRTSTSRNHHAR